MHDSLGNRPSVFDGGAAAASGADAAHRLAREIRTARRHSRLVRALKGVLPAASLVLFLTLFVSGGATSRSTGPDPALDAVRLSRDGLSMDHPRVSGVDSKGRPFEIQAQRATQSIANPKIVSFDQLHAKFRISERESAVVTSRSGVYDSEREIVKLAGDIRVRSDGGYEADLRSAEINTKHGSLVSEEPAVVRTDSAVIEGRTLTITDHGDRVVFDGNVRMILNQARGPRK